MTDRTPADSQPVTDKLGEYREACALAIDGKYASASHIFSLLDMPETEIWLRALAKNALGALAALEGDISKARTALAGSLTVNANCRSAQENLAVLTRLTPVSQASASSLADGSRLLDTAPVRVAILSFLFNWPSSGGGIFHTVELAEFLEKAGFDVQHIYAHYPDWGIGRVEAALPFSSRSLDFESGSWSVRTIQERFRRAVDDIRPDYVFITDAWNIKPLLAEAVNGYPYFLRFQALECICPLNNVRLLVERDGATSQCHRHQLADSAVCVRCVRERGASSGGLHRAERELCRVDTPEYQASLHRALQRAEAILVLNPLSEALLGPYAQRVCVVPWGMDPRRFPSASAPPSAIGRRKVIFQAGIVDELMKGFRILHEACAQLWQRRKDFELVATGTPVGRVDDWTRFIGWISQAELPACYQAADIVAVPTIAQEGLSRTSVEAMAAARPVVASRIGGLPFTVLDEATGLLCQPGDVADLAHKLERLLDDDALRSQMGRAGRRRFEECFSWPVVIERFYRPLLARR